VVTPLWSPAPEDQDTCNLQRFRQQAESIAGRALPEYADLLRWSIEQREDFWSLLWDFASIAGTKGETGARNADQLTATDWFPEAKLNFAENLLVRHDSDPALIARTETGDERVMDWASLHDAVERIAGYLAHRGIGPGDRVAGILPNGIEAVVAMLATARLGGVWSSCSPDFGSAAIIDRFAQIEPRFLFGCGGYHYAGRWFDCQDKLAEVTSNLPTLLESVDVNTEWTRLLDAGRFTEFVPRRFSDPLCIMFSSGTTGVPKCIVHGVGGVLLQHRKEHLLHCDLQPRQRLFFYTTCGWMMWNWLVSGLASGATLCLYDGAPSYPNAGALFRFVEDAGIHHFGISPGYISALAKSGYRPRAHHALATLRSVMSTGSPLPAESFDWITEHIAEVRVSSITGGTDILGCFALGNPLLPVYRGEIQCAGLGMDIAFFDEQGQALPRGRGELVCRRSFPSMPIGFWNDPDGAKYRAAYFETMPGVWHHGDFGEFTEHGGIIIHGRSDAVLNRGGVRIGTAELYRYAEQVEEVVESIAVAQQRHDGDVRILLFVRLREGAEFGADLEQRIRTAIRTGTSPRHVPDIILPVADIPRTRSGKLVELAVREVIHGRPVKNIGAIANPEALELFRNLPSLD
jgi:acetoacetyl-CoA synthetase